MALNAQSQSGSYMREVTNLNAQSLVEIKFSGQDIGEIIAAYPQINLTSCEVSSGRVNYGGRLVLTVVYAGEDGKLCRIQKGAEFSHYADNDMLAPAQSGVCKLTAERTQVKREGSSYVIAVVVGAEISIYDVAQRSFVSEIEGAVTRREDSKFYTLVNFSGESEVEDEFDCVAADVLVPAAEALVLDCSTHAGLVEVNGEIYLSLLAVRDSSPVCLDRTIPFKAELSCDEAILSGNAFCRAEIKEINVNCRVNEEKGKCDVEINATLAFTGRFYEEEETSLITDAFCVDRELKQSYSEENINVLTDMKVYTERVSGLCATKAKLDYTCAFLAAALPRTEFERTENGIEGSVTAILLYEQGGEIHSTEVNLPFTASLTGLSSVGGELNAAVCGMSLRQRAEGECEAEATLKITAADGETKRVRYLTEAEEGNEIETSSGAISVYIPSAGDGLWETAKRLCEDPENIRKANPELTFPLTGKERILIYRPKQA